MPAAPTCGLDYDANTDYYAMTKDAGTECLGSFQYSEFTPCGCDTV